MKIFFSICIMTSLILWGCNSKSYHDIEPVPPTPSDIVEIATSYKTLQRMTDKPVYTDPTLAMLCTTPGLQYIQNDRKTNGPHTYTAIHIYTNDLASKAFPDLPTKFPVGSIIIKEKMALPYNTAKGRITPKDGVGGMIKRQAGYDSHHGNWEYFYFTDPQSIESGKIKSCVDCHTKAAATDYVYGDWSKQPSQGY